MKNNRVFMKSKLFIAASFLLLFPGAISLAQETSGELNLSLKEAQDYALTNNKMVLAAKADVMASKASVWEAISGALPQINASGSFIDNVTLATTVIDGKYFGAPGTIIKAKFGQPFSSGVSVQASLLLFNAPLYIGIETTKLAQKLSEQSLEKSGQDTKESVSTAYFLILVSEKSLEILKGNIANLTETLKSTKAMYSAGMAEATDVDQMVSNLTMVENNLSSLERTIELNYNILRFQLGVPVNTKITLTETLETLTNEINVEALLAQDFDYRQNISYKLIEGQEQMSQLNLKSQKAQILPSLSGIYSNSETGQGDKVKSMYWSYSSMLGFQLSIPIFASGQRNAKINKAQINFYKARITKDMVTQQLMMQEKQLRYNLVNANAQYKSQKDNVEVSKRVYTSMENKFKQGMASSLDLTQANSLYLAAENNYVSALMNLLQTKLALDKLLNNM
jgi:outer membrane protein TolC